MCGVCSQAGREHFLGLPLDFSQYQMDTFRYSLLLDLVQNSLSLDIHVENSERHEEKLPSSTLCQMENLQTRGNTSALANQHETKLPLPEINWESPKANLSNNQGASC